MDHSGASKVSSSHMGFPKIRGTILGVPIIRIIEYWDYIGVPLFRETTIWTSH